MNGLFSAAMEVSEFMTKRSWKFCLIGGLAVQQWGEPRTTLDADFTLLTGWGKEEEFVKSLVDTFEPRISGAHEFAISRRILLLKASNGVDIDIALGALEFEESMIERARKIEFAPGIVLPCCSAEDLFIMKAFAGRPRDWIDAQGIVTRTDSLDKRHIIHHLKNLCDLRDDPDTLDRAIKILEEAQ